MTVSPFEKRRSLKTLAILASSLSSRSANSGTRCNTASGAPLIGAPASLQFAPASLQLLHGRGPRSRPGPRDRPTLQQVELVPGDRPLDVAGRAVDLLAASGEAVQLGELLIVHTEPFH